MLLKVCGEDGSYLEHCHRMTAGCVLATISFAIFMKFYI
jgi:hypothetical protein